MTGPGLEAQLEEATHEFVRRILAILRSASLADVAGVHVQGGPTFGAPRGPGRPSGGGSSASATRAAASPSSASTSSGAKKRGPRARGREDAEALSGRIMGALESSGAPVAARALADQLGVSLEALAKPLKLLRDGGRIVKQGDKRATKYAPA